MIVNEIAHVSGYIYSSRGSWYSDLFILRMNILGPKVIVPP